jgi:hypothetical protein
VEVRTFARKYLNLDITELYASREAGGIARDGLIYQGIEVELVSLPELGYFADGSNGAPRGGKFSDILIA